MLTAPSIRKLTVMLFSGALFVASASVVQAQQIQLPVIGVTPEPYNLPSPVENSLHGYRSPAASEPGMMLGPADRSAIGSGVQSSASPSNLMHSSPSYELSPPIQSEAPKRLQHSPQSPEPLPHGGNYGYQQPSSQSIPMLPPPAQSMESSVLEKHVLNEQQIQAMLDGKTVILESGDVHGQAYASGMIQGGDPYAESVAVCPQAACGRAQRFWIRGEAMALWLQGDDIPVLVTRSPLGTPQADAGQLGLVTTRTMFGGDRIDQDARLGGRISIGWWLGHAENVAVEAEFMFMQEGGDRRPFGSGGTPLFARPFFNVDPAVNGEDADLVAFDGLISGDVVVDTRAELYSGSFGVRRISMLCSNPCRGIQTEWLSGFRYLRIAEQLSITDNRTALANHNTHYGALAAGDTFSALDQFKTSNDFYGYDLGIRSHLNRGRFSLSTLAKIAIGVNRQTVDIDGNRTITAGGVTTTTQGGLLTSGNMVGERFRRRFAVVPQASITAGFYIMPCLKATMGYQFMLLSDAVRPGPQIDRNINATLLDPADANAGPTRPTFPFASDTIFLHGATAGLEFTF